MWVDKHSKSYLSELLTSDRSYSDGRTILFYRRKVRIYRLILSAMELPEFLSAETRCSFSEMQVTTRATPARAAL